MACWSAWREAARPLFRILASAVGVLGWAFAGLAVRGWTFYEVLTSVSFTVSSIVIERCGFFLLQYS